MRKIIISLFLLVVANCVSFSSSFGQAGSDNIRIIEVTGGVRPSSDLRSGEVIAPVSAVIDYSGSVINLTFNQDLGATSILISDQQGVVTSSTVNAVSGANACISVPSQEGDYRITIVSTDFYGIGYYSM